MIISHHYRYVFVGLPMTGSTAIRRELLANYDGQPILAKHATYLDFLRTASEEEKKYFVFSSIRNPLDQVVSHYFKFVTNHRHEFSASAEFHRKGLNRLVFEHTHMKRWRWLLRHEADFPAFFLRFYRFPYNNWSCISHERCDHVIRFERLAEDFAEVLRKLDIEAERPLPSGNRTKNKDKDFWSYYDTPEVRRRAMRVFGPYMKNWSYEFPPDWGAAPVTHLQSLELHFLDFFRKIYWTHLRKPQRIERRSARPAKVE